MEYFTPDIEDIRVGYECEIESNSKWKSIIITAIDSEENSIGTDNGNYWLTGQNIRVPYLYKEQIEAEGWKTEIISLGNYMRGYKKCLVKNGRMGKNWDYDIPVEFQITYDINTYLIKIVFVNQVDDLTFFEGECKDINTFRYICKLLKIN